MLQFYYHLHDINKQPIDLTASPLTSTYQGLTTIMDIMQSEMIVPGRL